MPMNIIGEVPLTEDEIFKLKISVQDGSFRVLQNKGILVVRVPGESVDPVGILEKLSEDIKEEYIRDVKSVVIISDYEVMGVKIDGLRNAIKRVVERDEEVAEELRSANIPPWEKYLFEVEMDPYKRKRCGIIIPGMWSDLDKGILEAPKNLTSSGDVDYYYLVSLDRYKKYMLEDFKEFLKKYREMEEEIFEEVEGEAEEVVAGNPKELLENMGFMLDASLSRQSQGVITMKKDKKEVILLQKNLEEGKDLLDRILKKRKSSFVILLSKNVPVQKGERYLIVPPRDMVSLEKFVRDVLK